MRLRKELIHYSPREATGGKGGGAGGEEGSDDQGPQTFDDGDGNQVTLEELQRGYKGTKETTQRFQRVSEAESAVKEREAAAERRIAEADERERKLNAARDEMLTTPPRPQEPDTPRVSIHDRLKEVDLIGATDANERLGEIFEEELEARSQEAESRHEEQIKALRTEFNETVEEVKREAVNAASQPLQKTVSSGRTKRRSTACSPINWETSN